MAGTPRVARIDAFYGGISDFERSDVAGVAANVEEIDIFTDESYIQPVTIFGTESTITRRITGYDKDSSDNLWALGRDASGTPLAQIWKKTTASADTPGSWASYYTSAYASVALSPLKLLTHQIDLISITRSTTTATVTTDGNHGFTSGITVNISGTNQSNFNGNYVITVASATTFTYTVANSGVTTATTNVGMLVTTDYLYYVTATNVLTRMSTTDTGSGDEQIVDAQGITMNLSGLDGTWDRIPMLRANGELYVGHGQFIARITKEGDLAEKSFILPLGWECVSFTTVGNYLAILARSTQTGANISTVFYWDFSADVGAVDETIVPKGGPQIIANHNNLIRVACAKNGTLDWYLLTDNGANRTHRLFNVATETSAQPIIPDATKFLHDNLLFYGLWKTDKTGLYALGQTKADRPFANVLYRRFATTDYSLHVPYAATSSGPNFYASYLDNATITSKKLEGNNSPTRSSNSIYESVWFDLGKPEAFKTWSGFYIAGDPIPASCEIKIDARVDKASSYDTATLKTLTSSNDQTRNGATANTYWAQNWTSVIGRQMQVRIRFTSSTTTKPTLFNVGVLFDVLEVL